MMKVIHNQFPGDHSKRVPPDPISNSEVKTLSADDSVRAPHVKVGHCQVLNTKKPQKSFWGFFFICDNRLYRSRFDKGEPPEFYDIEESMAHFSEKTRYELLSLKKIQAEMKAALLACETRCHPEEENLGSDITNGPGFFCQAASSSNPPHGSVIRGP